VITRRIARWIDDRFGAARFAQTVLGKVFPDHWSFMLGEVALYSFVMLVLTGTYLTFFFSASGRQVVYHGSYAPLRGQHMSAAYASVIDISFKVRAGMVMRQMHHWAALVFIAAIVVHLCRVFFTGAFRRPREINWIIGLTLLLLAMANGFTGYSLPDDQLSGTGLRIMFSILLSIPILGTWIAFLFFGGNFPTQEIVGRLFVFHVMLVPGLLIGLLGAHLAILWHQKHTQFPRAGRTERNIEGSKLWPVYALRSIALFFLVAAVLAALGGLVQINPVWLYGPFRPASVSAASQPDWYIGWLEGALRLMPPWEVRAFNHTIPNPFFPGVLMPGIVFTLLYLWPFLEARVTKDREPHNLLDRPRDRAIRTAIGAGGLMFFLVLFLAGGNDVLANTFHLSLYAMTIVLRIALVIAPPVVAFIAYRLCRELAKGPVKPLQGPVGYTVRRTEEGAYETDGDHEELAGDEADVSASP
jgi:ubiquinol-cytochrome c reductase cytochrome b subunit